MKAGKNGAKGNVKLLYVQCLRMSSTRLTRCTDLQENDADDTPLEVPVGEKDTRKNIYSEHVTQKSNMYWSCLAVIQYLFRIMRYIHMAIYIRVRYVFFVQVDGAMCTCFCHFFQEISTWDGKSLSAIVAKARDCSHHDCISGSGNDP